MPPNSDCPSVLELEQALAGLLPGDRNDSVASHIEKCGACLQTLAGVAEQDTLVAALRRRSNRELLPTEDFVHIRSIIDRVHQRLDGKPPAEVPTLLSGLDSSIVQLAAEKSDSVHATERLYDCLAPSQQPGEIGRLGNFRVLKVLGTGGMGVVFEAEDIDLKRPVALKVMKPEWAADEQARKRYLREAQLAASLSHDHIVTVYQVGTDRSTLFLAMQLLAGESLQDRLAREGRLPVLESLRIVRESAEALSAAHVKGLIHRDIKPGNIWLEAGRGRVKILDFGLARSTVDDSQLTQSGMLMGTPSFMAPEQARGETLDGRADLFSLGCVLYRMTTGELPFTGPSTMAVLTALAACKPKPPRQLNAGISPAVERLILDLLAPQPDRRPPSAADVVVRVAELERQGRLPNDRTVAEPHGADKPPGRRHGRFMTLAAGLAGVALLAGMIIIKITTKDGTVAEIKVSEGSTVEIVVPASARSAKNLPAVGTTSGWHGWPADAPPPAIAPFDAEQAKKHQEAWAAYLKLPVEYTNSIGMKLVLIPPGEFMMGSTPAEMEDALKNTGEDKNWLEWVKSEAPQHKVILTQPIYLGIHEVTQTEYEKVVGKNPSSFAPMGAGKDAIVGLDTSTHPVEMVSWNDAAEFCAKLSKQEKLKPFYFRTGETVTPLDGTGYRLPTEAEWEFSCRAGTTSRYWIGAKDEEFSRAGWFRTNSGRRTHAVGELKANPFGLYDIHGNVYEWVQDLWEPTYYGQFRGKSAIDPTCQTSISSQRVIRGGGLNNFAVPGCRASDRQPNGPVNHGENVGFRMSLVVDAVRQALKKDQANDQKRSAPQVSANGLSPISRLSLVSRPAELPGVKSWTIETRQPRGMAAAVYQPDGKVIFTAGADGSIRKWDRASRELLNVFPGHSAHVWALACSSKGDRLASVDQDGELRVWNARTGQMFWDLECTDVRHARPFTPDGIAFSPDGKWLAFSFRNEFKSWEPTMSIMTAETGEINSQLTFDARVVGFVWAKDSTGLVTVTESGELRCWNLDTMDTMTSRWQVALAAPEDPQAYPPALAIAPHQDWLAVSRSAAPVRVLELATGREVRQVPRFKDHHIWSIGWTGAAPRIAALTREDDLLIEKEDAAEFSIVAHPSSPVSGHYSPPVWSPDGTEFLLYPYAPDGNSVRRCTLSRSEVVDFCTGIVGGNLATPAISPNGRILATDYQDCVHRDLWDLETGQRDRRLAMSVVGNGHSFPFLWSPDSGRIVSPRYGTNSAILDVRTGKVIASGPLFKEHANVAPAAFSPNGRLLATGRADGQIEIWNADTVQFEKALASHAPNKPVYNVAWSPDGHAIASSADRSVKVWSFPSGKEAFSMDLTFALTADTAAELAWSPDSRKLAVAMTPYVGESNQLSLVVYDVAARKEVAVFPNQPMIRRQSLSWRMGGSEIVACEYTKHRLRVWNVETMAVHQSAEFPFPVFPAADGRTLVGSPTALPAHLGRTATFWPVWNAADPHKSMNLVSISDRRWLAVNAQGHFRAPPIVNEDIVYVVQTDAGFETLAPAEFSRRFNWKNDPDQVRLGIENSP